MNLDNGTIGNIITIITGIIGVTGAYFTLKFGLKATNAKIFVMQKDFEEQKDVLHNRIDKTQDEAKKYTEKTDQEFKEINQNMSTVLIETSEIKGMLKTLLDKK